MSVDRREFISSLALMQLCSGSPLSKLATAIDQLKQRVSNSAGQLDWSAFRREFVLDSNIAYLNTGSVGCTPRFLLEQLQASNLALEKNPFENVWLGGLANDVERIRKEVAEFWSVTPDELTFTENTTAGLAAIAQGIDWKAGDEVILSNHEHLSCISVWKYIEKRYSIKLTYVELPVPNYSDDEFLNQLASKVGNRTRMCCLSHVDALCGIQLPISRAAQLLREKDIPLICDAAQSVGMLDFDFRSLGCSAIVGSGHKWLMGPKGQGIMFIDRTAQELIRPLITDWSYQAFTPCTGTRNIAQLLGWSGVLEIQTALSRKNIAARINKLSFELYEQWMNSNLLEPLRMSQADQLTGITAWKLPKSLNSFEFTKRLASEFKIEIKPLPPTYEGDAYHKDRAVDFNAFRLSTQVYNNADDLERITQATKQLLNRK